MFFAPLQLNLCLFAFCVFVSFRGSVQGGKRLPVVSLFLCFFLTFPHYKYLHISTFQRGTANVPIFAQIFFFCAFARSHLNMCLSPFLRSVQGGEKVEIRWRKGGERLPVVSLFLRLTLFLTPAASQHLPTLEKQKTFEKYFL